MKRTAYDAGLTKPSKRTTKKKKFSPEEAAAIRAIATSQIVKRSNFRICEYTNTSSVITSSSIDNAGTVWDILANMSMGDADLNQAGGNTLDVKYWEIRGHIFPSTTHTTINQANAVRVILAQRFASDSTSGAADILSTGAAGTFGAIVAPKTNVYEREFKILRDELFEISTSGPGCCSFKWFVPGWQIKDVNLKTNGAPQYGALELFAFSNDAVTPYPQLAFWSRVKFKCD